MKQRTWLTLMLLILSLSQVYSQPRQTLLSPPRPLSAAVGYQITALADYQIEALLFSTASYETQTLGDISPIDWVLVWGDLAQSPYLPNFKAHQKNRQYFWQYWGNPVLSTPQIIANSANVHLIPATPKLKQQLQRGKSGDFIQIQGYLVEVEHPQLLKTWRSSLSRSDQGHGACEIIYVTSLRYSARRSHNL